MTAGAAVLILLILLAGCGCLLWWQQLELNTARRDLRELERRYNDEERDRILRRRRLGLSEVDL